MLDWSMLDDFIDLSHLLDRLWDFEFGRFTSDCGLEAVVVIGGVFNDTAEAVSVDQGVHATDNAINCFFRLTLDVTGLFVMSLVAEVIGGWCFRFLVLDDDRLVHVLWNHRNDWLMFPSVRDVLDLWSLLDDNRLMDVLCNWFWFPGLILMHWNIDCRCCGCQRGDDQELTENRSL